MSRDWVDAYAPIVVLYVPDEWEWPRMSSAIQAMESDNAASTALKADFLS